MKVYISGPITGVDNYEKNFSGAETKLKALGLKVINPADPSHGLEDNWENYMKRDIKMLMDCDAIYMLDNWKTSPGAVIEHALAEQLKMLIITQNN